MITEKIKKIFFNVKNGINEKMKEYNITAAQTILLEYLNENQNKTIILKNICDYLSLKHSTVISILKRLEEKELITRKTNYTSEISITKNGIKMIETCGIKKGFVDDTLLKGFTEEEIEKLNEFLDRINNNTNAL